MLVFEERGKPEYPEKNLSEQGKEPATNLTHIGVDDVRRVHLDNILINGIIKLNFEN